MTTVVVFLCTNGVVVAAGNTLTTNISSNTGHLDGAHRNEVHRTGKKVAALDERQVLAFAGNLGQGARFQVMADGAHDQIDHAAHPINYPLWLSQMMMEQFQSTGIGDAINVNTVLAYIHGDTHHCCIFEDRIQPRLLNKGHFYESLGSEKLAADSFLHFLVDVCCQNRQPNISDGVTLATWAIEHVIRTNPSSAADSIWVGTLKRDSQGVLVAREFTRDEVAYHLDTIAFARISLHDEWRVGFLTGDVARNVLLPP